MSTIVFVHAHPDDEASQTSGSMARASAQGHRVVTVFGTNGDHGELHPEMTDADTVVTWRRREAQASADALGVARVAWLGYADSGMTGWAQNTEPDAFMAADVDEAAGRLVQILDEEDADWVVGYDWHGGYGHPDHIQVHRVVHRAAELAARRPRVLETSFNRDTMRRFGEMAKEMGLEIGGGDAADSSEGAGGSDGERRSFDPDGPMDDGNPMGTPEAELHWAVDVSDYMDQRRASMEAHRSQATDIEGFLSMPEQVFTAFFSTEFYLEPGREPGMQQGWPFDQV